MKLSLDGINGALYSMPAGAAVELSDDPDVLYVSPDRPVQGALDDAEPTTNANIAFQSGWDGKGIGIALIDSGVTARPDLQYLNSNKSRIVYSQSFLGPDTSATDQYGHGTHVAGILAGNGKQSTGSLYTKTFRGIAPNAKLINLRVLDSNGAGQESSVNRGDSAGHPPEEQIQHPRDQSLAGPAGV